MKKIFMVIIFLLCFEKITVSNCTINQFDSLYCTVKTQREDALERAFKIFQPNEIVVFIIDEAIKENVNPLDVLAFIKIENSNLTPDSINKNIAIEKTFNRKLKKTVYKKVVVSTDIGIGQLNSKYLSEYEWFYWVKRNETEKFNPKNYKHNVKVCIRLYKTLTKELNNRNSAVIAYNTGIGKFLKKDIPQKTLYFYLPQHLNNLEKMGVPR